MKIEELLKEASLAFEEEKLKDAVMYLETVLEIEKSNLRALMMLTKIFSAVNDYETAMNYCEQAYKHYSDELEVIFSMGYLHQEIGKNKKALIYYEKFIEKEENYHVLLNMSICYMDLRYFKKALETIERAILKDPKNMDAYFDKAECYVRMSQIEKAVEIYENKIKKMDEVEDFYLYMKMGDAYYISGNVDKAIECYNISINSEFMPVSIVYDKFYNMLMAEKRYDEVELLLLNYENSNFPKVASLNMEGRYASFKNDFARAQRVCEKLIALEPENPINYFNLITVLEKQKKYGKALEMLEKIEKYLPEDQIRKNRKRLKMLNTRYLKKLERENS